MFENSLTQRGFKQPRLLEVESLSGLKKINYGLCHVYYEIQTPRSCKRRKYNGDLTSYLLRDKH